MPQVGTILGLSVSMLQDISPTCCRLMRVVLRRLRGSANDAGVTNYKVSQSDLAGTFKKGAAPGCQTATCGLYANEVRPAPLYGRAG